MPTSDVAFTPAVKRIQAERGSREAYARLERRGGFASAITDELRAFLHNIDTAFLATASADAQPYIQHRGGPPGFIRAIDDGTLAWAELGGNRQYITAGNLSENDRVCLFLIDYATRSRVKVWGTARMVPATPELLAQLGPHGDAPVEQVVLLAVQAWDINCRQHIPQKVTVRR
jgi:predicted pyridoxine 5'-phosphate oxidase superfamily flavin-nucleotide-binding protein